MFLGFVGIGSPRRKAANLKGKKGKKCKYCGGYGYTNILGKGSATCKKCYGYGTESE